MKAAFYLCFDRLNMTEDCQPELVEGGLWKRISPMGQQMNCIGTYKKKTSTGFEQTIKKYQTANCEGCPLRSRCHKSKGNRIIEINHQLNNYKRIAKEKRNSEEGIKHRKQRPLDVEPVFGNIKNNHHFKRFMLRGKDKVAIEFGLLALAQNIRKKAA